MTWAKICGITNLEDALTAVEAGADALGFVFYEKSPRNIDAAGATNLVSQLPASIEKVGVFVNQREDFICEMATEIGLSAVQFHGSDEDPHVADLVVARHPGLKVLVAVPMLRPQPETWAMMWSSDSVYAFLADTGGGTGKSFDWAASKGAMKTMGSLSRVVVAGGLTPENVADSINILHPWGVDVSSGVEKTPGKKDPEKVRAFISAVRNADKVQ
jgi:phosphoribosylanthranilate isomerase